MFYSPRISRIFVQFVGKWNQPEHSFPNCKQTLSPFHALRREWFSCLQFLRFPFLGNFESLGKYNVDGLAKNFEAEKKNDFVSSLQLSYMSVKTILYENFHELGDNSYELAYNFYFLAYNCRHEKSRKCAAPRSSCLQGKFNHLSPFCQIWKSVAKSFILWNDQISTS